MATADRVTREDIEQKFRELKGEVDSTTTTAKSYAMVAAAVGFVAIAGIAFWMGRRRGRKTSTVVEIRRV